MSKSKVKINKREINKIKNAGNDALTLTARWLIKDLKESETMPWRTGATQKSTKIIKEASEKGRVNIASTTDYAEDIYFSPWRFNRDHNRVAGPLWFQKYIDGNMSKEVLNQFAKNMKNTVNGKSSNDSNGDDSNKGE